jgi:hypothetical protein
MFGEPSVGLGYAALNFSSGCLLQLLLDPPPVGAVPEVLPDDWARVRAGDRDVEAKTAGRHLIGCYDKLPNALSHAGSRRAALWQRVSICPLHQRCACKG